jgi:alpha-galactosidase
MGVHFLLSCRFAGLVDGKPASLLDLGYGNVGIDDCWQDCLSPESLNGSFHSADGTPLIDKVHFPNMRQLSDKAASAGVGLGWYGNNCPETSGVGRSPKYCSEHGKLTVNWPAALKGDVQALIQYNFSSVKLDNPNCGANGDMQAYYDLVNTSADRSIVIENCTWCNLSIIVILLTCFLLPHTGGRSYNCESR